MTFWENINGKQVEIERGAGEIETLQRKKRKTLNFLVTLGGD